MGWPVLHSQTWVGGGGGSLLVGPIGGRALDHRLMSVGLSSLTRSVVRSDSCWDRQAKRRVQLSRVLCLVGSQPPFPAPSWSVWPLDNYTPRIMYNS